MCTCVEGRSQRANNRYESLRPERALLVQGTESFSAWAIWLEYGVRRVLGPEASSKGCWEREDESAEARSRGPCKPC